MPTEKMGAKFEAPRAWAGSAISTLLPAFRWRIPTHSRPRVVMNVHGLMGQSLASWYTLDMHDMKKTRARKPRKHSLSFLVWMMWTCCACPSMTGSRVPGGEVGTGCRNDLACADGLECVCGLCAVPGPVDMPPSCDVQPPLDECRSPPIPCWSSCDNPVVVAAARCIVGVESCAGIGVHPWECEGGTCQGEPAPGEVCQAGEYVCALGRSEVTDSCYTEGCEGEPRLCTSACGEPDTFAESCLAGFFQCETGVLLGSCPACLGEPPRCVRDCVTKEPVAIAFCQEQSGAYSCAHVLGTLREDECIAEDAGSLPRSDGGESSPDAGHRASDAGQRTDAGLVDASEVWDGAPAADGSPGDATEGDASTAHTSDAGRSAGADGGQTGLDGGQSGLDGGVP